VHGSDGRWGGEFQGEKGNENAAMRKEQKTPCPPPVEIQLGGVEKPNAQNQGGFGLQTWDEGERPKKKEGENEKGC